jgi:hypothetical protein
MNQFEERLLWIWWIIVGFSIDPVEGYWVICWSNTSPESPIRLSVDARILYIHECCYKKQMHNNHKITICHPTNQLAFIYNRCMSIGDWLGHLLWVLMRVSALRSIFWWYLWRIGRDHCSSNSFVRIVSVCSRISS